MNLSKALDDAIAAENRRYLADTAQQEEDARIADIWRQQLEQDGLLPKKED